MAARPGEDLAVTLFADIHYYYGVPTAKPPHHRFDKGSYVYLFENPSQRRARIEIANSAGTSDQDAFTGYLDSTNVHYSYEHTTLVSLTVDGHGGQAPTNNQEWHLPTFDPRNENKYMYKLHTIDIYFWKKQDALQFMNAVRRVLPQHQITVKGESGPPSAHHEDPNSVVQQLENVAISDPSYQQKMSRQSSVLSYNSTAPSLKSIPRQSFPGPPPISATPQSQEATNFTPMAYNPAAPAAPEAIKHREKTPPPEDGNANPLAAAAATDQGEAFGSPYQHPGVSSHHPQHQHLFHGPMSAPPQQTTFGSLGSLPPHQTSFQGALGSPPPQQSYFTGAKPSCGVQSPFTQPFAQTPSFAAPPSAPAAPPAQHTSPLPPPPGGPPAYAAPAQQYANYPQGVQPPGIQSPGMQTPGMPPSGMQSPSFGPPHAQTAPLGGCANYNYQKTSNTAPLMSDYSIHSQVYRPTEGEAAVKTKPAKPARGKLEDNAAKLEKGVGGLLKKMEKRWG